MEEYLKILQKNWIATAVIVVCIILFLLWQNGAFQKSVGNEIEIDEGGDILFDGKNEAIIIHDTLRPYLTSSGEFQSVANRILDYTDDELAKIVNAYNKHYKKDNYPTIRQLIVSEDTAPSWLGGSKELKREVLTRLSAVGA